MKKWLKSTGEFVLISFIVIAVFEVIFSMIGALTGLIFAIAIGASNYKEVVQSCALRCRRMPIALNVCYRLEVER